MVPIYLPKDEGHFRVEDGFGLLSIEKIDFEEPIHVSFSC